MEPSTANIRRFLVDAFNAEELKSLCFDYFRDVYDDFAAGMTKGQMIQLLIERCVRREAIPSLQAALRAERADQYEKRFGPPGPAVPPVELPPAGRDPRQVFVSHALVDADFAHRLAGDLESKGWRIWIAPDSIPPGEKWVEAIGRGLDGSGVFLVVLTPAAVGSPWVKTETNAAIESWKPRGEVQFVPLDVAACAVPILWNVYQSVPLAAATRMACGQLLGRLGTADGETRRQGERERGEREPGRRSHRRRRRWNSRSPWLHRACILPARRYKGCWPRCWMPTTRPACARWCASNWTSAWTPSPAAPTCRRSPST